MNEKLTKMGNDSDTSESSDSSEAKDKKAEYFEEMITQLKTKFETCTNISEKLCVLTAAPASWSARKLADVFGASFRLALRAKKLQKQRGSISDPNPKQGNPLSSETTEKVRQFYMRDDISREMPGKKDFLSVVNDDGKREHLQKRLMLCNLWEAHQLFKRENPDKAVGLSKFSELRPPQCIFAGSTGTHSVCVCAHHQNVKLMMEGSHMRALSENQNVTQDSYRHCLAMIMCNPPSLNCIFRKCEMCSGTEKLQRLLEDMFDDHMIDKVQYRKWFTTDRSTLEIVEKSVNDFIPAFCDEIEKLTAHDFVAKSQSSYLQDLKHSLADGEVIVIGDFAENYSFVIQDEIQSYHWSKQQVTLHPFVCYWVESGESRHTSYVAISECLVHDTAAVHLFQRGFSFNFNSFNFLQQKLDCKPKKIFYFSDGCAGQYKNRNFFINLCHHELDYGIPAEWHFFATSHGKGPCDGVGGTLKRMVSRASLESATAIWKSNSDIQTILWIRSRKCSFGACAILYGERLGTGKQCSERPIWDQQDNRGNAKTSCDSPSKSERSESRRVFIFRPIQDWASNEKVCRITVKQAAAVGCAWMAGTRRRRPPLAPVIWGSRFIVLFNCENKVAAWLFMLFLFQYRYSEASYHHVRTTSTKIHIISWMKWIQ